MPRDVGAAVAIHQPKDRPGIVEVVLVLAVCAGVLMALATFDDRASRREAARAGAVLAERAKVSAERAARESMTAPRTERLGREDTPIAIPAGPAFGPGSAVMSIPRKAAAPRPAAAAASPRSAARDDAFGPVLLLLMGGGGLSMVGAGLRLLSRRSA
jgi:hypothetical protein